MPLYKELSSQELMALSPLQLAFVGDAVYDLMVRGHMLRTLAKPQAMHQGAENRVNATAQARTLRLLEPHLTQEEKDYARKGRNAQPRHPVPRSASSADYSAATALETLFGYLYVTGQQERLAQLFALSLG